MDYSRQLRKTASALVAIADEIDRSNSSTAIVKTPRRRAKAATNARATTTTPEQVVAALTKLGRPVTASELAEAIPGARGQAVRWLAQSAGARVRNANGVRLYSAPPKRARPKVRPRAR